MSIKPKLGIFDLTMIVVSLVIGMGIFRTPVNVARETNDPALFFGIWVVGGIVSICGALTYAEIGSRYPVAGGFYKVLSNFYHPAYGFMINWMLLISNAASVAAVCLIGAEYISPVLLPDSLQNDIGQKLVCVAAVLLLYGINMIGIRMSVTWLNVLTVIKIGMMVLLCLAVFSSGHPANAAPVQVVQAERSWLYIFGAALVPVFFTFGGYQQTINFGSDVKDPGRNMPRGIFYGFAIIVVLYLTINYAYYKVIGFENLQHTNALAARMAEAFFGPYGFKVVSLMLFFSVLGYANVNLISNPRMYYAMAEDGVLPAAFKRVNSKTQVQEVALSVFVGVILLVLFFADTFEVILRYVMLFDTIGLASAAASIFILRKRTQHLDGTGIYKMKLYPYVTLLFVLVYLFVTVNIFIQDWLGASIGLGLVIAGLPLYLLMKQVNRKAV